MRAERSETQAEQTARHAGVSSLAPSFSRALPGPSARRLGQQAPEGDRRKPEVVVGVTRNEPEPPAPRYVGVADRGVQAMVLADDTTPLPVEEVNLALRAELTGRHTPAQRAIVDAEVRAGGAAARAASPADPIVHIDGLNQEVGRTREAFTPAAQVADRPALALSPLDETAWVAGIPRCCDTCREFHRDATGKRGYCRSPYAFGSRTMVESDQLACRSSIGVWWLPSDDAWLERADISHHTRPTPYLDAILAELRPESR